MLCHVLRAARSLFNNLQPPSSLQNKCDYYLFKEDIRPEWEDKANTKGGRWVIEFDRRDKDILNRSWTYTVRPAPRFSQSLNIQLKRPGCVALQVLAMIGEQFEDNDEICGAVVRACLLLTKPQLAPAHMWLAPVQVSIRPKKHKLQLWTRTASNTEAQKVRASQLHP